MMGRKQKIGELMERGLDSSDFIESHWRYLDAVHSYVCGCALGAAFIGIVGNAEEAARIYQERCQSGGELLFFCQVLDIDIFVISKIDEMHRRGRSALEIAKRLKEGKLFAEV